MLTQQCQHKPCESVLMQVQRKGHQGEKEKEERTHTKFVETCFTEAHNVWRWTPENQDRHLNKRVDHRSGSGTWLKNLAEPVSGLCRTPNNPCCSCSYRTSPLGGIRGRDTSWEKVSPTCGIWRLFKSSWWLFFSCQKRQICQQTFPGVVEDFSAVGRLT